MNSKTKHIVVLGGGYAGVMTAVRLAGKTKRLATSVTLVNGVGYFVERPRLHEQATGARLSARPLAEMLAGTKARLVRGWVTAIQPEQKTVLVQTGSGSQQLTYDTLVFALGSRVDRQSVPGVEEHAYTLDPDGDLTTDALGRKLTSLRGQEFRVIVVGGGPTGIEAAAQIKAVYPDSQVSLVTQGDAGAFKGPAVRRHLVEALREQQVTIHEQCRVTRLEAGYVVFEGGQLAADVIVWAGGFRGLTLASQAGFRVNTLNQVLVDPFLRSVSHPDIFAVGDAACPVEEPGAPWRMSLFTALVSAAHAADTIAAEVKGNSPRPLSYAWYGQGIAVGPRDAVGFPTYPADLARWFIVRRTVAVYLRRFFVWYLGAALEFERLWPGFFFWNGKQRYARQRRRLARQPDTVAQVSRYEC